jgi:multiple sugar transport system permease protein
MTRSRRRASRRLLRTNRAAAAARWLVMGIAAAMAVFPVVWIINAVFQPAGAAVALRPKWIPTSWDAGVSNISAVLDDPGFVRAFANSMIYATIQTFGTLLLASMAGYEFAHGRSRDRQALFAVCLIGLMVPVAVTLLPTQRLVSNLGWLNSIQGIVVPLIASSFALFVLTENMRAVPRELIDAAHVDGAGHFRTYWRIALPLTRNGLLAVGILIFVAAWGNYIWPLVVATRPDRYPVSVAVARYYSAQSHTTINEVMAASLVSVVPVVIVYIALQRHIVDSVARVGIKG